MAKPPAWRNVSRRGAKRNQVPGCDAAHRGRRSEAPSAYFVAALRVVLPALPVPALPVPALRPLARVVTPVRAAPVFPGRRARDRRGAVAGAAGCGDEPCWSASTAGSTTCGTAAALASAGAFVAVTSLT